MDFWKFFTVGHEHHVVCNPLGEEKLDELIGLLALPGEGRLLDIACGKGELLVRAARRWGCHGVGVDLSTDFAADARAKVEAAGLTRTIEIVEANGRDYDAPPESFDAAICLGASWIWEGLGGTLDALAAWARPGGTVVVGEPFWWRDPSPEYLEACEYVEASFGTHRGNVETGLARGLALLRTFVSSADEWDRYEGTQWWAIERYARLHPEDPDVPELVARVRAERDQYLRWGREELGWAVYLFLKDPHGTPDPAASA